MWDDLTALVAAVGAIIVGVAGAWAGARKQKSDAAKTEADTSDVITAAAERVVLLTTTQMTAMAEDAKVAAAEAKKTAARLTAVEADVAKLRKELATARGVEQELRRRIELLTTEAESSQVERAQLAAALAAANSTIALLVEQVRHLGHDPVGV